MLNQNEIDQLLRVIFNEEDQEETEPDKTEKYPIQ